MPLSADDRIAIGELLALHGHLADDRRDADLHLLFTDDVVYDISAYDMGQLRGLAAVTDVFSRRPGEQPLGHHVTNIVVTEHTEGTVTVRSKGLAVMANGAAGTVVYDDVVVRTDDGWRIAQRAVIPARVG